MDVNLRQVTYFVAVAETLHFGRAAERLYISQPSLSQQIRRFETALGFDLFLRDRRSVRLTAAGQALLAQAQLLVGAGEDFDQTARRLRRATVGELVVGFHVRWPYNFLPRVIREFSVAQPDVTVKLDQFDFGDTSAGVRTSASDVGLVHLPLTTTGLEILEVASERRVVMVAEDHPLAGRGTTTITELVAEGTPWAVPTDDDPVWRDFWGATAERAAVGAPHTDPVQPMTQDALYQLVASGQAIALTYTALAEMQQPTGISLLMVADLAPAILGVTWRMGDDRPHVRAFIDAVRRALETAPHPCSG